MGEAGARSLNRLLRKSDQLIMQAQAGSVSDPNSHGEGELRTGLLRNRTPAGSRSRVRPAQTGAASLGPARWRSSAPPPVSNVTSDKASGSLPTSARRFPRRRWPSAARVHPEASFHLRRRRARVADRCARRRCQEMTANAISATAATTNAMNPARVGKESRVRPVGRSRLAASIVDESASAGAGAGGTMDVMDSTSRSHSSCADRPSQSLRFAACS